MVVRAQDVRTSQGTRSVTDYAVMRGYYESLESRIGYKLLLGGTRHFGYWDKDTYWPFPVGKALRRMEEKLFSRLDLAPGSRVVDAGCGDGYVAMHMARKGLHITAIDVIPSHVERTRRNIARSGLPKDSIAVQHMDYHDLEPIASESHDGVYTVETFVHAADPAVAMAEFYRILKPGGRCVLLEYEVDDDDPSSASDRMMAEIDSLAYMPTHRISKRGLYKSLMEDAGFVDVKREDFSDNVKPLLRLFFVLAIIPYTLFRLLGVEKYFPNTMAGAVGFGAINHTQHYVAVRARKPGGVAESAKSK